MIACHSLRYWYSFYKNCTIVRIVRSREQLYPTNVRADKSSFSNIFFTPLGIYLSENVIDALHRARGGFGGGGLAPWPVINTGLLMRLTDMRGTVDAVGAQSGAECRLKTCRAQRARCEWPGRSAARHTLGREHGNVTSARGERGPLLTAASSQPLAGPSSLKNVTTPLRAARPPRRPPRARPTGFTEYHSRLIHSLQMWFLTKRIGHPYQYPVMNTRNQNFTTK